MFLLPLSGCENRSPVLREDHKQSMVLQHHTGGYEEYCLLLTACFMLVSCFAYP
jgi:hypothetical protein